MSLNIGFILATLVSWTNAVFKNLISIQILSHIFYPSDIEPHT